MGKKAAAISSSSFFFKLVGSVYLTTSKVKKWSKACKPSLLCALFSSNYLFLQFFPFSFHILIPWLYPKLFWEIDRPKAGHGVRNSLLYDIIASMRAYWLIVTLFWAEPQCSVFRVSTLFRMPSGSQQELDNTNFSQVLWNMLADIETAVP